MKSSYSHSVPGTPVGETSFYGENLKQDISSTSRLLWISIPPVELALVATLGVPMQDQQANNTALITQTPMTLTENEVGILAMLGIMDTNLKFRIQEAVPIVILIRFSRIP